MRRNRKNFSQKYWSEKSIVPSLAGIQVNFYIRIPTFFSKISCNLLQGRHVLLPCGDKYLSNFRLCNSPIYLLGCLVVIMKLKGQRGLILLDNTMLSKYNLYTPTQIDIDTLRDTPTQIHIRRKTDKDRYGQG